MTGVVGTPQGLDLDALYRALDDKRRARGLLWRDVAEGANVEPAMLSRMTTGVRKSKPNADAFVRLVWWLGMAAENFFDYPDPPKAAR